MTDEPQPSPPLQAEAELEALLEYIKRTRSFDFTGYKRASLARRVAKRMQEIGVTSYADYTDFLEVHPDEFALLFDTVLLNVTTFFRDEPAWEWLARHALPELLSHRGPDVPIRVWSAGCATGQEAYTLAMIWAELLGPDAFRERVKIYATDADEGALTTARLATYTQHEVAGVPPTLLAKYFDRVGDSYVFKKEFRRQVIFGRHDLIQDAPISRVDLLVCRNVLMYFNAETQSHILGRFHFALNDHGVLFLGRAETLLSHAAMFVPLDTRRRISAKIPRGNLAWRDRLLLTPMAGEPDVPVSTDQLRLRELAFDTSPTAQVVVGRDGVLALANERARQLFGLSGDDVGRPLQDLRLSYRPVELRSLVDQVYAERRSLVVHGIESRGTSGDLRWHDVQLAPLVDADGTVLGASASYVDVTAARRLQNDIEIANAELETAYEELQSTNEELETTNEELQSTIEELETTNEELQSTNEELETMNEELQSTNHELGMINEEVRERSDDLNRVNAFLGSVLASLGGGVIVLDAELRVLVWNAQATDLWGVREDEVHARQFFALDIGLPVDELRISILSCLAGGEQRIEVVLAATNRRGRAIRCQVTCTPLRSLEGIPTGVILVMNELGRDELVLDLAQSRNVENGRE